MAEIKSMTQQTRCDGSLTTSLEAIAGRAYAMIASAFPVCAFSDEFYFFPQVVQKDKDWKAGDDFSAQAEAAVADLLREGERDLSGLVNDDLSEDGRVDIKLILHHYSIFRSDSF